MNRYFRIGLALAILTYLSPSFSFAQTGPVIRNSVSVCDPSSPTHCEKPNAAGAIPISGSITATNPSVGTNGAAAPTSSTQIGVLVGANLQPASNSNPVPVGGSITCLNCSGSGAAAVDQSTFTAGTSVFAPAGVFFQTTATSNPLTNGQQGMLQSTAQRAAFVNLRNASGAEIGTSTTPVQVTVANTGANATAIKVDGSAVTQPTSLATLPALTAGSAVIGHVIADTGSTTAVTSLPAIPTGSNVIGHVIADTGSTTAVTALPAIPAGSNVIGHVIADSGSTTAVTGTVASTQSGTWTVQPGNTANTTAWKVDGSAVTQPVSTASLPLPTGAATSAKQPALGTAGSSSSDVISVQGIASGTALPISAASLPLPTSAATSTKQSDGSQKTQIVDGSGNVVATTSNNLNVQCANCTGSGVSAVDGASFTAGASVFAPTGVFYQATATSNSLTAGQQGMIQGTAQRAAFINLRNASGAELGIAATPLQVSLANTAANGTAITVSLPTGASTSANQASIIGTLTAGTSATNSLLIGGVYNSTAPTLTTGQQVASQVDIKGALYVSPFAQASGKTAVTGTCTSTTNSSAFTPIPNRGINVTLSGTFVATEVLQRSFDGGSTWFPITIGSSPISYNSAVSELAWSEPESGVQIRLACTWTSGTVTYRISQ